MNASKSGCVTFMLVCASTIDLPSYLQPPPVIAQTCTYMLCFSFSLSTLVKKMLIRGSAPVTSTNSSTTALIAG